MDVVVKRGEFDASANHSKQGVRDDAVASGALGAIGRLIDRAQVGGAFVATPSRQSKRAVTGR